MDAHYKQNEENIVQDISVVSVEDASVVRKIVVVCIIDANTNNNWRTNVSQRLPKDITDKVTRFILYFKRKLTLKKYKLEHIYGMDETAIWYDSVGNTTVEPTGVSPSLSNPRGTRRPTLLYV